MDRLSIGLLLALAVAGLAPSTAQGPPPAGSGMPDIGQATDRPFRIVRNDPALDAIIDPSAKLELVGDRFGLTEGAVWLQESRTRGHLLFSDMTDNVIYRWTPPGQLSIHLDNAGYTGNDLLNVGMQTRRGRTAVLLIGPNGLTLDTQGRLVICAMPDRNVARIEKDGKRTVLAERFEGKRFSGPNDVVVKSNGSMYFTDGNSGVRGGPSGAAREMTFNGFFLIKDGKVTLGDERLRNPQNFSGFPNGITLSPDERFLYVTMGRSIVRYEVQADDTVANPREFASVQGNDGMKTDVRGNLYTTTGAGPGEVRIWSPEGKRLGSIELPQTSALPRQQICATNLAFGDPDGQTLFITACMHVYRIRLKTAGVMPGPKPAA
jgi:gluconolactonase